jgi:hypothetical protein
VQEKIVVRVVNQSVISPIFLVVLDDTFKGFFAVFVPSKLVIS